MSTVHAYTRFLCALVCCLFGCFAKLGVQAETCDTKRQRGCDLPSYVCAILYDQMMHRRIVTFTECKETERIQNCCIPLKKQGELNSKHTTDRSLLCSKMRAHQIMLCKYRTLNLSMTGKEEGFALGWRRFKINILIESFIKQLFYLLCIKNFKLSRLSECSYELRLKSLQELHLWLLIKKKKII